MSIYQNGILYLYGSVGGSGPDDDYFSPRMVIEALAQHGPRPITVQMNSGGGYATDGAAIYNALLHHPGRVSLIIDGISASAASLIAMAGDEITMRAGSAMMIHDPAFMTVGTAADHRKTIEELDVLANTYASIYASRSGKTKAAARALMVAETWMEPDDAIRHGFADKATSSRAVMAAEFNYSRYAKAPKALADGSYRMGLRSISPTRNAVDLVAIMQRQCGVKADAPTLPVPKDGLLVAAMRKQTASRDPRRGS